MDRVFVQWRLYERVGPGLNPLKQVKSFGQGALQLFEKQGFKTGFSQTSLFFLFKWRPNGGNPHGKIDYLLATYKIIWLRKPTPKFALFGGFRRSAQCQRSTFFYNIVTEHFCKEFFKKIGINIATILLG